MKKKQKIIAGVIVVLVTLSSLLVILLRKHTGRQSLDRNPFPRCSQQDREQNNCVPAGRCTPPGDPRESTIDCDIKKYDHKFNLGK